MALSLRSMAQLTKNTLPVKFKWQHHEQDIPIIKLNDRNELEQISFSNQSIQPFDFHIDIMEDYYEAYCNFCKMAESDEFQLNFRMVPGDLNMIDNYRLLHGRTAFSGNGTRSLVGYYLGRDGLYSYLEKLKKAPILSV